MGFRKLWPAKQLANFQINGIQKVIHLSKGGHQICPTKQLLAFRSFGLQNN
jgi:hypothetical protein